MCQERFPAQEIIVPVGGYCYILDVGGGGVPMKNVCEETSAVAGAEPKSQLEPRHNGGRSDGGWDFGCGGIVKTSVTWTR